MSVEPRTIGLSSLIICLLCLLTTALPANARGKSVRDAAKSLTEYKTHADLLQSMRRIHGQEGYDFLAKSLKDARVDLSSDPKIRFANGRLKIGNLKSDFEIVGKGEQISYRGLVFHFDDKRTLQGQIEGIQKRMMQLKTSSWWHQWLIPQAVAMTSQEREEYLKSSSYVGMALSYLNKYMTDEVFRTTASEADRKGLAMFLRNSKPIDSITCSIGSDSVNGQATINYLGGSFTDVTWGADSDNSGAMLVGTGRMGPDRADRRESAETTKAYQFMLRDFCSKNEVARDRWVKFMRDEQQSAGGGAAASSDPARQ